MQPNKKTMSTPKISVIVPVYNAEKSLCRCIDSILTQTYQDFELLLIDDGSKDSSGAICDSYAAKDSRIKVFHKPNGGVSSARNLGIDNAQGEWLTFVDADDWVEENFLMALCSVQQTDMVVGKCVLEDKSGLLRELFCVCAEGLSLGQLLPRYLYHTMFHVPWGKLFRLSLIRRMKIRFHHDMKMGEDLCFVFRYLSFVRDVDFCRGKIAKAHLVHYAPDDFVAKYAMNTMEAARHFTYIWDSYKHLHTRCVEFENRILNDVFELCKVCVDQNPVAWYGTPAVREAYIRRGRNQGGAVFIKTLFLYATQAYKWRILWRIKKAIMK